MGRIFEHQEIINTPEAKGMRMLPSPRGVSVAFGKLKAKKELRLPSPHPVPGGRQVPGTEVAGPQSSLSSITTLPSVTELLQIDPQANSRVECAQSLCLVTEFAGLDDANWTPPDSQIAAGPDHLVAAVNATFAVFDKLGRQLLRRALADVFSPLVADALIFNPKVIYDQFHGLWVMTACACSVDAQRSWFLLAFSQSCDPMGDWWIWALDAGYDGTIRTSLWPDGLGLAVDSAQLYLTANLFTPQGEFAYSKLRVLNIKEMQSGGVLHGWDFWQLRNADGSLAFGVQPALNLRAAGAQYLLNATADGQGLTQWTISHPTRQAPALTRRFIQTAPHQFAPDVEHPARGVKIGIGDSRLGNVVFRHGLLWAAHTIRAGWNGNAETAAVHWMQVNPRAGCVTQQGIYGAPDAHYFCPAVMVDGEGNMLMVFNQVSGEQSPSIRFTGRRASDENGLLQASELLLQGSASASCEWSHFNGAAVAPDDSEVWLIGQYIATESDLPTWIGAVRYGEPSEEARGPYSRQSLYA